MGMGNKKIVAPAGVDVKSFMDGGLRIPEGYKGVIVDGYFHLVKDEIDDGEIGRRMLEHFKNKTKELWCGIPVSKIIAWLEKRKEQKKDNPLEDFSRGYNVGYKDGFLDGKKQKEQKPVKKLSRDEYVKRFKTLCKFYEINLPNREYDIYHLCDDLSKLSIDCGKQKPAELEQLAKLREMTHEIREAYERGIEVGRADQKPAEWSEEDERIRKGLYDLVISLADKVIAINGITKEEALAYLEKQKEQKSKVEHIYPKFNVGDEIVVNDDTSFSKTPLIVVGYNNNTQDYVLDGGNGPLCIIGIEYIDKNYRLVKEQKPADNVSKEEYVKSE